MIVKDIELRGRKQICEFMQEKWWTTAKRRLKDLGILCYDGCGKPVLNMEKYRLASLERQNKE